MKTIPSEFFAMASEVKLSLERERETLRESLFNLDAQISALEVVLRKQPAPIAGVPAPAPFVSDEVDRENATQQARQIISESSVRGVRPREITRGLRERGFNVTDQFASNTLFRLRKKGETVEHRGRHYQKGFEPKAVDQTLDLNQHNGNGGL